MHAFGKELSPPPAAARANEADGCARLLGASMAARRAQRFNYSIFEREFYVKLRANCNYNFLDASLPANY